MTAARNPAIGHRPGMDLSGVTRPVVVPVRIDPHGVKGPTRGLARGRAWRFSSKGLVVPAEVDPEPHDQRVVEAAAVLPDDWGGVTGGAALGWCGGTWFDGTPWGGGRPRPVVLAVGGNRAIRPQPAYGIETSEERLAPHDLVVVDGVRVTVPVRSVTYEMRYARSLRDAVTTLDMACFNDLVSLDEVDDYARNLNGWTGAPQLREARALASENSWSPQEVVMRLEWERDAGFARPLCNQPVFDLDGRLLGVPDLLDPAAGVFGEYDGSLHLAGEQRAKDLVRENALRTHGLEGATKVAADRNDPTAFLVRLAAAYDRASYVPASRRRWTIEQPDWWRDTTTVAGRRALDADVRARLLAHRVA
jgi:hypothetical protein